MYVLLKALGFLIVAITAIVAIVNFIRNIIRLFKDATDFRAVIWNLVVSLLGMIGIIWCLSLDFNKGIHTLVESKDVILSLCSVGFPPDIDYADLLLGMFFLVLVYCIFYFNLNTKYMRQRQKMLELKLDKYETLKDKQAVKTYESINTEQEKIKNSAIYQLVLSEIKDNSFRLSEEQWKEIHGLLNEVYEGFGKNLNSFCEVTNQELKICMLLKLGVSPVHIAKFTHRTKEAISASRRRMYEKTFKKKGTPAEWDNIVQSL